MITFLTQSGPNNTERSILRTDFSEGQSVSPEICCKQHNISEEVKYLHHGGPGTAFLLDDIN